MEKIDDNFNVIVDCGYEIDSVKNSIENFRNICKGRLIGIMGINYSDNDNKIRNLMQILEDNLDLTILTEDESLQGEVMNILDKTNNYSNSNKVLHIPYRSIAIENAIQIMNKNDILLILGKGNEKFLSMGLGKERYLGDKHYALKYIQRRKDDENETI